MPKTPDRAQDDPVPEICSLNPAWRCTPVSGQRRRWRRLSGGNLGLVDKMTQRIASSRKGCTFLTPLGVTEFDG